MARFSVKHEKSGKITHDLKVTNLKEMAQNGTLLPADRVIKEGHTTWHLASTINGLDFVQENVTSVISLESSKEQTVQDTIGETNSNLLSVKWCNGRQDGPFELSVIKELAADGFILHDCTFKTKKEQEWVAFTLLNLQPKTDRYHVSWTNGRNDGPFLISELQELVNDGFILNDCQFKKSKGTEIQKFNSMNLLDTSPSKTVIYEKSTKSNGKVVVAKKWRKGWFRRLVVKTTAAILIIGLVIALGGWGVWTAMPESQRDWATKKYEEIKTYFDE
jgi:hypothetical protein